MFLSDVDILRYKEKGQIEIDPWDEDQLQACGYDLRLHKNFRKFKVGDTTHIDVKEKFDVTELVEVGYGSHIILHPGEFVLGATNERISFGNQVAGLLEGRSSLARIGIVMHATAGLFNPGFSGHVTFEMSNISNLPVKLYVGMRVAQMVFVPLSSPVSKRYGKRGIKSKYQDQKPPTPSKIWKDFE